MTRSCRWETSIVGTKWEAGNFWKQEMFIDRELLRS